MCCSSSPYSDCTWETPELINNDFEISRFRRYDAAPSAEEIKSLLPPKKAKKKGKKKQDDDDLGPRQFRDCCWISLPHSLACCGCGCVGADPRPPRLEKPFDETDNKFPGMNAGRELRGYQLDGLNWLAYNWHERTSAALSTRG